MKRVPSIQCITEEEKATQRVTQMRGAKETNLITEKTSRNLLFYFALRKLHLFSFETSLVLLFCCCFWQDFDLTSRYFMILHDARAQTHARLQGIRRCFDCKDDERLPRFGHSLDSLSSLLFFIFFDDLWCLLMSTRSTSIKAPQSHFIQQTLFSLFFRSKESPRMFDGFISLCPHNIQDQCRVYLISHD